jgi:protein ImuB
MRRVISVWLPTFPIDRLQRIGGLPPGEGLFVTSMHDGRRRVVAAAGAAGRAFGITSGMSLAHAQALVPGLGVVEAEPDADAAALTQLATWCLRYAPLVAVDAPDGIWIDATGCTHLSGGEDALLADLIARLKRNGFAAHAAIAGTPGVASAVARYSGNDISVVPTDGAGDALAPLSVQALRLPPEMVDGLRRLGFDRIGDLLPAPRAPLVKRFGAVLALRLAQALGEQFETIHPLTPPDITERHLMFVEPLSAPEAFVAVLDKLMRNVCRRLERASLGARRLDLLFERMDNSVQTIRINTAQPSRDAVHLARLLRERFEQVDPGVGVEAMRLIATTAEPLAFAQIDALSRRDATSTQELAGLMDRLINRFGAENVYRFEPVESDVPERSVQRVPALAPPSVLSWPVTLPRPVRLLTPPEPVMAIAPLPDHPPAAFTWRRHRHRIRRADGPERIAGEWWRREGEVRAVRDYFAVEDEDGRRFWLFRRGDGEDATTGDLRWFLHGFF